MQKTLIQLLTDALGDTPENRSLLEQMAGGPLPVASGTGLPARFGSGGAYGAEGYSHSPGGAVLDTSGSSLGFSGAIGDILGNQKLGQMVGGAIPGNIVSGLVSRGLRSLSGPYGVVGLDDVHIGHPQWGQKMALRREASRRNAIERALGAIDPSLSASVAGRRAGYSPRGGGGGAERGGRDTRDHEGKSSADRHSAGNY